MTAEDEFRESLAEMLDDVEFPVQNKMALATHLPNGPATKFDIGDQRVSAMELASELSGHADFPYDNLDDLIDDAADALRDGGYF